MSVSTLTHPEVKDQVWSDLYMHSINTETVNAQTVNAQTVSTQILDIGAPSSNHYTFPSSVGTRQQILVAQPSLNALQFDDNLVCSLPFGGNIGSANNYFKYSSPVNSSPTPTVTAFDAGINIPFSGKLKFFSYSTELGIGNGVWTVNLDGTNTALTFTGGSGPAVGFKVINPPINTLVGQRLAVGILGGTTFPGQANITFFVIRD